MYVLLLWAKLFIFFRIVIKSKFTKPSLFGFVGCCWKTVSTDVQNSFLLWNRGSIILFFLAFLSQFHAEFCELHSYCVHFGSCKQHFLNSIYYGSKLLGIINYGTFNSFLAGLGGNQVDSASYSVQMTNKPVQTISATDKKTDVWSRDFIIILLGCSLGWTVK